MSMRGRYIIDRMKRAVGNYIRFPVPPYADYGYWENVYSRLSPDAVYEFGRFSADDLASYSCRNRTLLVSDVLTRVVNNSHGNNRQDTGWLPDPKSPELHLTIRDMLGLPPSRRTTEKEQAQQQQQQQQQQEEPILVLGCGNSRFGEQLWLDYGCRGPIIHVDTSSRVIHDMTVRNKDRLDNLIYVQDDAAVLSALGPNAVVAAVDKGMIDAVFCTDDYETCWNMIKSAHRVLRNGGVLSCFSFSEPDFLLPKILLPSTRFNNPKHLRQLDTMWQEIQVQQLDFIFLYRFVKTTPRPVLFQSVVDARKRPTKHHSRHYQRHWAHDTGRSTSSIVNLCTNKDCTWG